MSSDPPDDLTGLSEAPATDSLDGLLLGVAKAPQLRPPPGEGTRIGRYVLIERLGAGAMGVVWAAFDPQLDRKVALKILRRDPRSSDTAGRARAAREARALAKLIHPNIVAVHDGGIEHDALFVVMEYVDGVTLRGWLAEAPRTRDQILDAFAQAAAGLAAAHQARLVHRDFKPDNVLVGKDGRVRVADFGLARIAGAEVEVEVDGEGPTPERAAAVVGAAGTVTGGFIGTLAFMAPEQLERGVVDARADQFAFAVSLWTAVHGASPFQGTTASTRLASIHAGPAAPPGDRGVPAWLHALVRRGLAARPAERYPTMAALLDALERGRGRRRRIITGVAVTLGLAAVGALAVVAARPVGGTSPCGAIDDVAAAWSPVRRDQVAARFAGLDAPWAARTAARVTEALDGRAAAWTQVATRACRATRVTRTWTDPLYARARHCLDRRLGELDAVVDLLAGADRELAVRATELIDRLPAVESCGDPTLLDLEVPPPQDPALAAAVAAIETRLDDVVGLQLAGRFDQAITAADALAPQAAALDHPPLTARLAQSRAHLAYNRTDADATARLTDAYFSARRAGLPLASIEIALLLIAEASEPAAAQGWWRTAEADVVGLRLGAGFQARIARARAVLLDREGKLDEARVEAERALQLMNTTGQGDDAPDVLNVLDSLGAICEALGRHGEAVAYGRRAVAGLEARVGPDHPAMAYKLGNLGLALSSIGDQVGAEETQTRALAVARAGYPAGSVPIGYALLNLGLARIDAGHVAEGVEALRESVQVLSGALGPAHQDTALAEGALGLALMKQHDFTGAEAVLTTALAHTRARTSGDRSEEAVILHNLGANANNAGRPAEARRYLEQAIDIYHQASDRRTYEAGTQADLASVLLELGAHADAVVAASAALDGYRGTGIDPNVVARAELLLARAAWGAGSRAQARAAIAAAAGHVTDDDAALRADIAAWQLAHP